MDQPIVKEPSEYYTLEIHDGGIRNIDNPAQFAVQAETTAKRCLVIPQTADSPMERDEVTYFSPTEFVVGPSGEGISFEGWATPHGPEIEKTVEAEFVEATRPVETITLLDLASGKTFNVTPMRIDEENRCRLHTEKLTLGN